MKVLSKKYLLLIIFGLMSGAAFASHGVSSVTNHFVYVDGSLGYSTLLNNTDIIKPGPGVASNIGFGYKLYRDEVIFQAGVQGAFMHHRNYVLSDDIELEMLDTEEDPFTLHAKVTDCKDISNTAHVQVPLLVGWERNRFYLLGGLNLGINVIGKTYSKSLLTTTATYPDLNGTMHDMDNHFLYRNKEVSSESYKLNWKFNLMAHLEVGARVDNFLAETGADVHNHNYRMYLSAFAEYGILDIHKNTASGSALSYREVPDEGLQFFVVPSMVSDQMRNAKVHPLTVGIRFTVAFEMPKKKACVLCDE